MSNILFNHFCILFCAAPLFVVHCTLSAMEKISPFLCFLDEQGKLVVPKKAIMVKWVLFLYKANALIFYIIVFSSTIYTITRIILFAGL